MKKFLKYILSALVAVSAAALTSCSPEDFPSVNAGGVPSASDFEDKVEILVDQETNQVTFNLHAPGHYPIWIIDGKTYSTVNGLKKIYTVAGDYQVEVKIANANGISDGTMVKTFTLNETKFDFSKYYTFMTGGTEKQWYVASKEKGHLGCGEEGSDGQGWWSASPEDKAAWGVYDDVMTFTADGGYTYNPGDGGTVYVNTGVTGAPFGSYNTNDGQDYMVPVEEQTTTYTLEVEGPDLYVVLPAQTLAPYIPTDDFYNSGARYRVESMTGKKMVLLADLPGITWRLILTTEKEEVFEGFKYNSEFNLWTAEGTTKEVGTQYYAPGWAQIADAEYTVGDDGSYTIQYPEATSDRWQAQFPIFTNISTTSATTYDFSLVLTSAKGHKAVMIKLEDADGGGNVFYTADEIELPAGEPTVFWRSDMPGLDITSIKLTLDFGWNEAGDEIRVEKIVLKDHANDDGTVLPAEDETEEPDVAWVDFASADNLWYNATIAQTTFWWADNSWTQIADPTFELTENGFKLIATDGVGTNQWQAQVALETADLNMDEGTLYDVQLTITPSCDIPGVTTKICHIDNDLNGDGNIAGEEDGDSYFLMEGRTDCPADESTVISFVGVAAPANPTGTPMKFCFDFGGIQSGAAVEVTNIIIQKHVE